MGAGTLTQDGRVSAGDRDLLIEACARIEPGVRATLSGPRCLPEPRMQRTAHSALRQRRLRGGSGAVRLRATRCSTSAYSELGSGCEASASQAETASAERSRHRAMGVTRSSRAELCGLGGHQRVREVNAAAVPYGQARGGQRQPAGFPVGAGAFGLGLVFATNAGRRAVPRNARKLAAP